jgi:putative serine protease PepD
MPRRPRTTLVASLLTAACLGAGGGALSYALLSDGGTTVRQVTVERGEPASSSSTAPLSVNGIYRRAYRGVVEITVTSNGGPLGESAQGQGSGFVYDTDGHIVTNEHVVDGATSVSVRFWNGKTYSARVVGTDDSTDLAVLDVDAPPSVLHPLSVGDSSEVQVGDGVVAMGSPFGLEETVTSGIVSALHRTIQAPNNFTIADAIQTDAAINHGNSGGPLLNTSGKVIGVNAQIRSESGGNEGVGFAIPSNTVRSIVTQLISSGKVEHAYLGVSLDSNASAARIAEVRPGTPAASAGLRAGDVALALDGTRVSTSDELSRAVDAHKPGDKVTLRYRRDGKEHTVEVTLATRPS